MDIGIISDIHGDLRALDTALERLNQHHRVQHVICAGDLRGRGPDGNQVVTRIRELEIVTVKGNHDEWDSGLSAENADYLRTLPINGEASTTVYMCHGKPGNNLWGLYRDHISNTLLDMMLASLKVDVLVTGHTRVPLYARVQSRGVNQSGFALYVRRRSTSHSYGILSVPSMNFNGVLRYRAPTQ